MYGFNVATGVKVAVGCATVAVGLLEGGWAISVGGNGVTLGGGTFFCDCSVGGALSVGAGSWVGGTATVGAMIASVGNCVVMRFVVGVSGTGIRKVHAPRMNRMRIGSKYAILFMAPLSDLYISRQLHHSNINLSLPGL